jgi:predicted dehydrogenase
MNMKPTSVSRRRFVKTAAAAGLSMLAAPTIVSATSLGRNGRRPAPSDRIVMGFIGTGGKGQHNLGVFLSQPDVQCVAVCDPDRNSLEAARQQTNKHYQNEACRASGNFRELLDSGKFDAVCVSTPDHWHALASIAALNAGAHVYCEKPLANSVLEGRAMVTAANRAGKIIQCGSQERSTESVRLACEQARNGKLGKLHTVEVHLPTDESHHLKVIAQKEIAPVMPVPEGFDYDGWLGFTPWRPFRPFMPDEPNRGCHFWWRFNLLYGGGEMTDRGAHIIDLAQLALGKDDTGPVSITAQGRRANVGLFDAWFDFSFENVYADGTKLVGTTEGPRGLKLIGDDGWIMIHIHGGRLEASDPRLIDPKDAASNRIQLGRSPGHHRNFLDCLKSGEQPFASGEIGHRTATICHLNNIAMTLGRKLTWSPEKERFDSEDDANQLLGPKMRSWLVPSELADFVKI